MAVTSGFFSSLNGDRKYSAEQFSALIDNLVTDGVFANVGTAFEVKVASDSSVTVGIGRAWFNSTWLYNDTLYPMAVQEPEVLLNRIDAIVIEINRNEAVRTGSIRWVYGSPSSSPSRPELTNTDEVHQYPLAYVLRKAGRSSVIQADITNVIGTSVCPYVTGILSTQSIDKVVAQWESQFSAWFDGLQTELSGDVAANLASQIIDLQSRFQTIAREKAIYETLQDSDGSPILDGNSQSILGKTVLGGEDNVVIVNGSSQDNTKKENFEVGDIRTTVRADLDDTWRLCNGDTVDVNEYSQLASICPPSPGVEYSKNDVAEGDDANVTDMIYANGYYIMVGSDGDTGNSFLAYATSPNGPWTKKYPFSNTPISIAYGNGYYVGVYREYSSSTIFVYYSASLTASTWELVKISRGSSANEIRFINGYFVIIGQNTENGYPSIWYAQNPTNGWIRKDVYSSNADCKSIDYVNGYYVITLTSSTSGNAISYSTSLDGSWSRVAIGINAIDFTYANGYYLAITETEIYYSESLKGPFKEVSVITPLDDDLCRFNHIEYDGTYALVCGDYHHSGTDVYRACIFYSRFARGPFDIIDFNDGGKYNNESRAILSTPDYYVACRYVYGSSTNQYARVYSAPKTQIKLPEITVGNGAYAYIKVKEG